MRHCALKSYRLLLLAGSLFASTCVIACAEEGPEDERALARDSLVLDTVRVVGERQRGSVTGEATPITEYNSSEIAALGASSIEEIVESLAPQTASSRGGGGRPVVLLNGKRIASFREIRDVPPEAIDRVEILPEEVALRYGYPAGQRVLNFVLREHFRALTAEAEYEQPTRGAGEIMELEATYLRLRNNRRVSLSAELRDTMAILETDRTLTDGAQGISLSGAVFPVSTRTEIDPGLSALAGFPVTSTAIPASALTAFPSLEDFAGVAAQNRTTSQQEFRTLQPDGRTLALTGSLAIPIGETRQASVSLGLDLLDSASLLGLPRIDLIVPSGSPYSPFSEDVQVSRLTDALGPLRRDSETRSIEAGFGLDETAERWSWNFTSQARLAQTNTETFRTLDIGVLQAATSAGDPVVNPYGAPNPLIGAQLQSDESETVALEAQILLNGRAFELPAGDAATSLIAGLSYTDRSDHSRLDGIASHTDLDRLVSSLQVNADLPIFDQGTGLFLPGKLDLNLNVRLEDVGDFGMTGKRGAGLVWRSSDDLRLSAGLSREETAPSLEQLLEPAIALPNQIVFDFTTSRTALVTLVSGGNPDLLGETRHLWTIGAQYEPFKNTSVTLRGDYTESRTENPVSAFPALTAEIEAAFPGRFVRDAGGTLIAFDRRPANLKQASAREWRWSMEYGRRGERRSSDQRSGGRSRGLNGRNQDPFRLTLVHTWTLTDQLTLTDVLPEIDYLSGGAASATGGRPEHVVNLRVSGNKRQIGGRLDVDWQSSTFVSGPTPGDKLEFSDLIMADARVFYAFRPHEGSQARSSFLNGARISLSLDNVFDQRLTVGDVQGVIPTNYQADRIDARGRTIRVEFRKLFP